MTTNLRKSEEEWKKELTPEQYRVLREKGTETPFTGEYADSKEKGMYVCAACGTPLFSSEDKFDSNTGWPSYTRPVSGEAVDMKEDASHGMRRTEVLCSKCGGHLGHVFPDGPGPEGQRFCINSCSLKLKKEDKA